MKSLYLLLAAICCTYTIVQSQDIYTDSINNYINNYVDKHEVVKAVAKKYFRFYPINKKFFVTAKFALADNNKWFTMETSGSIKKTFRVYGNLSFTINDTLVHLNIYQSKNLMQLAQYKDLLFLPFTDATTGTETYEAGRYLDISLTDIKNNTLLIDFNKAYNPYCAYLSGKYNCPIPPKENNVPVAILAGEKIFSAPH
jgi:uncharacterized protein (DUF1684 family)